MSASLRSPAASRMTTREFLAWPGDGTGRRWQLIDGELAAMAPPSGRHGLIQAEISGLLREHLRKVGSPCNVVVGAGVSPRLRSDVNVRIPDLTVECSPDDTTHLLTQPVLIVEILSPSNETDTWRNIWAYATLPSLREMLMVRSLEVGALFLRRLPDGSWPERFETVEADPGVITLDSIGGTFRLRDFYATTGLRSSPSS